MKALNVKTSGSGEPLLLLHGWGMNSHVWSNIKNILDKQYRVSLLDFPGHGINHEVQAETLEQIITLISDHVENKTHIIAWSLGGLIAQVLAHSVPDKVSSLTLIASTPSFVQRDDWSHAMHTVVLDQFATNLTKDVTVTIKRFIALQFMGIAHSKEIQRQLMDEITHDLPDNSALHLGLKLLKTIDLRNTENTDSPIPRQWILGERDRLVPAAVADDLSRLYTQDKITLIANAGHAPFMTHPDQVLMAFDSFIKAH